MARDLQEFERQCDLLRQALAIPGMSIAVVQAQELVLARGFGIVDLAEGTPAAADTPYPVASLTKTFAAAVIMRLVEAGKLDLDEAMATYDPDYRHWCETIMDLPEARNYNCAAERSTVRHHAGFLVVDRHRRPRRAAGSDDQVRAGGNRLLSALFADAETPKRSTFRLRLASPNKLTDRPPGAIVDQWRQRNST